MPACRRTHRLCVPARLRARGRRLVVRKRIRVNTVAGMRVLRHPRMNPDAACIRSGHESAQSLIRRRLGPCPDYFTQTVMVQQLLHHAGLQQVFAALEWVAIGLLA